MINIEFICENEKIIIEGFITEKMNDIFNRFSAKLQININSIYFIFEDKIINNELTLSEIAGLALKDSIKILVLQAYKPKVEESQKEPAINQNLVKSIKEIKNETNNNNIIENDTQDKLCSNLEIIYETLSDIKGIFKNKKNFDYYEFVSSVLLYELNKNNFPKYRKLMLEKIINNNNLIKKSSQIIDIIIQNSGVNYQPKKIKNNLKYLSSEISPALSLLNKTENNILEEILMNIFERNIAIYFELLPNKNEIFLDKSFSIFKDTIKILDDISNKNKVKNTKNSNLLKLYSIVYVKMYLYNLTYLLVNKKYNVQLIL